MTSSSGRSMAVVARAIAAAVLRPVGSVRISTSGNCSATRSRWLAVGHDHDVIGQTVVAAGPQPVDGVLEERPVADERKEGLGAFRPAEGLQPGPAAAGQDDRVHRPLV